MSKSTSIRSEDVRALLRLSHELHTLPADRTRRVHHFLERVNQLLKLQLSFVNDFDMPSDTSNNCDLLWWEMAGWVDPGSMKAVLSLPQDDLDEQGPMLSQLIREKRMAGVHLRRQVVEDKTWYRSDFFNSFNRTIRTDDQLIMAVAPAKRGILAIGAYRGIGERPFSRREYELAKILREEFAWFLLSISSPVRSPSGGKARTRYCGDVPRVGQFRSEDLLAPQVRKTLHWLLCGDSEKQVALRMGLSQHTIHDYVKRLYRHFDVNSRSELLARCRDRGEAGHRA